ncbi:outer membrane protein with beta-barrel domain [Mucilaginibacter yixingensis]|uniref:Outer membrane protein with beta-barrel domain n=2 Tax=Mucilaginibacter yixingensis TaxID=1295612 RepID=A0A2T5J6H7_9SPHI|nr:outer membrane protein with beta-barrel domain [Mucilaginibacter yixingensis]
MLSMLACTVFAQTDSVATDATTQKSKRMNLHLLHGDDSVKVSRKIHKHPGFSIAITFSRFDLGLATLIDNGSFTLSPKNQFLNYRSWKSSNVGFDVFQFGYRFNSAFKIYMSAGLDWTLFRLRDNITIQKDPDMSQLHYTVDNIDYSKNRFSSSYLRIPLSFDFRTKDNDDGKRFHFVAGPDIGILLNGRVKQISSENGKQKFNDDYHYTKLRYGAFTRIGYGDLGIYAKYYFNDMFNTDAQKGLKNMSIGLTLGF